MPENNSVVFKSALKAVVIRASGEVEDKGVVSERVVTTVGVNALVDAFQGIFTLNNFKYHISGTDTAAEAITDTEATITGATPNPVVGSQIEGASANIYKTVASVPYVSTLAITSHGLINNATKAGSVLWDRSVFAAINVVNGDSIEFTYELTCNAGG
jgi:hypothetical protein